MELKHALEENGIARGPLLSTNTDKKDVRHSSLHCCLIKAFLKCLQPLFGVQRLRLYRLHLQNTEMPPNFATLLQLREMLSIPEADAEELETEVFESGSAFSI